MTDFFSFTKVKAPDLSASASLYRGAQESVSAATTALNRASNRINLATQEKDTRMRTDNTNQLIAQINQATTLDEVNELQKYVASEDFNTEYQHGFYIDAEKVNEALLNRPTNISHEQKIKTDIQSRDEGTSVQGYVSGVNAATTKAELDTLRKDYLGRNYTAGNLGKLNKAYSNRLADLELKRTRDLQFQTQSAALRKEQKLLGYESDMAKLSSAAIGKLGTTEGLAKVDVAMSADTIARQLVEKYSGYVSYDDAYKKATTQLEGWYQRYGTKAQLTALEGLSPDQRDNYIGATLTVSEINPTQLATQETQKFLDGQFPFISAYKKEAKVTASELTSLTKDKDEDVVAAISRLHPTLMTPATVGQLTLLSSAGAEERVAQLNSQAALYDDINLNLTSVRGQAANRYALKRDKLAKQISRSVARTGILNEKIKVATRAGDSDMVAKFKGELNAEHNTFESLTTKMTDLATEPTEAAEIWKASKAGQKGLLTYMVKTKNDRKFGNPMSRLNLSLSTARNIYNIPPGTVMNITTLMGLGVPQIIAEEMARQSKQFEEEEAKVKEETKANKATGSHYVPYQ